MFQRKWIFVAALSAVLPFTLVACGGDDDDDVGDKLDNAGQTAQDAAGEAKDKAGDAAEEARSAVAGVTPMRVNLDEVNDSGVDGDAVLTPEGPDRARASFKMDVDDNKEGRSFTAGIWEGQCPVSGEPEYDLGKVDDGTSTEAFDTGLDTLKDGDYAVAVRDGTNVVACGNI